MLSHISLVIQPWFIFLLQQIQSAADDKTLKIDPLDKTEITTSFSTTPNRGTLQPKMQPLTVYHDRISCHICFVSSNKRNTKRGNFQKLTDLCRFK